MRESSSIRARAGTQGCEQGWLGGSLGDPMTSESLEAGRIHIQATSDVIPDLVLTQGHTSGTSGNFWSSKDRNGLCSSLEKSLQCT